MQSLNPAPVRTATTKTEIARPFDRPSILKVGDTVQYRGMARKQILGDGKIISIAHKSNVPLYFVRFESGYSDDFTEHSLVMLWVQLALK